MRIAALITCALITQACGGVVRDDAAPAPSAIPELPSPAPQAAGPESTETITGRLAAALCARAACPAAAPVIPVFTLAPGESPAACFAHVAQEIAATSGIQWSCGEAWADALETTGCGDVTAPSCSLTGAP